MKCIENHEPISEHKRANRECIIRGTPYVESDGGLELEGHELSTSSWGQVSCWLYGRLGLDCKEDWGPDCSWIQESPRKVWAVRKQAGASLSRVYPTWPQKRPPKNRGSKSSSRFPLKLSEGAQASGSLGSMGFLPAQQNFTFYPEWPAFPQPWPSPYMRGPFFLFYISS